MTNTIITANGISINGTLYAAQYSKTPAGTVFAFVQCDGNTTRIRFEPSNEHYGDALAAWQASYASEQEREQEPEAQELDQTQAPSKPVQEPEEEQEASESTQEPEQAQELAQAEPREKAEKVWIGSSIKGKGWEIYFDGGYDRTRVIFKRKPSPKVIETVKAAGFFWSPHMKSWNKKLTCKAFRAAQTLAMELRAIGA